MKRNFVIGAVMLLLSIACITASAQTRPAPAAATPAPQPTASANVPDTKIALVDTAMFGDARGGIKRYLNAVSSVQLQFKPKTQELVDLQTRMKTIADEITRLNGNSVVDPKSIQAKQEEGERLQRDFKYKKEQLDADFEKRYNEIVGPVSADIGKALDQYAGQHGLTMILDISKLLPAILTANPAMDITTPFIAEYNSRNP
ncbi:MAG TPA: OmpH family outer membrane protein [Pyrinomonadaceae bacterium]|jgi:Skp family chaperone for outer membrane proteins|nr:OmpH family outer membrane protein [Pyrinomonadaceae bacterium]